MTTDTARLLWRWDSPGNGHVCLFAHYDPQAIIDPYVLHYLRALRAAGLRICVISPFPDLAPGEITKLRGLADALILRENAGLDFGAWQAAMAFGLTQGFSHILLANDSVYGPLRPLAPYLSAAQDFDAWGMMESWETTWHLQSWFVLLTTALLRQPDVAAVLARPFTTMTKPEIIDQGELGLGRALRVAGARCGAASRGLPRPWAHHRWPVNRMHFEGLRLARHGVVPFLKQELLRDNPQAILGARHWSRALAGSDYDPALIAAHLARVGPRLAPRRASPLGRLRHRLFQQVVSFSPGAGPP